jgi:hypothetical protein
MHVWKFHAREPRASEMPEEKLVLRPAGEGESRTSRMYVYCALHAQTWKLVEPG